MQGEHLLVNDVAAAVQHLLHDRVSHNLFNGINNNIIIMYKCI